MIRVLHAFKTYLPESTGGIERVIYELCENAPANGIKASVATLSDRPAGLVTAVGSHRVIAFHRDFEIVSTGFSWDYGRHFARLVRNYDLIHYHFPWPFMDLVHLMRGIRKPYVVSYHADIVKQSGLLKAYEPLMRSFLKGAARVVATSPNYVATSPYLSSFSPDVVPLGVSPHLYPQPQVTERLRPILDDPAPYVLSIGVNRHYKGFSTLLEAAGGLDARVVFVSAGPNAEGLEAELAASGRTGAVLVRDASEEEKMALLERAAVFAQPSLNRAEAYGIGLVEAAMMGKPLVSCEIGTGTTFVNLDGETGFVVPPGDADALRGVLNRLLLDPDLAGAMGENARRRFETELTGQVMAGRYADIYREVLGAPRNVAQDASTR